MATKREKKRQRLMYGISFFAIVLVVALAMLGQQGLTVVGDEAWLPEYYTAECVERADSMATLDLGDVADDGEFFKCTSESGKYVPLVNGVQCEYTTSASGLFSDRAVICDSDADSPSDASCYEPSSVTTRNGDDVTTVVPAGKSLYLDPVCVIAGTCSIGITAQIPSYGLRVETADGFVEATTNSCLAATASDAVDGQLHTLDLNDRVEIIPDAPFNAVTGLRRAKSNQLVQLDGVAGGSTIYISRPGYYFEVGEAEDGFKFVDTRKEFSSSRIECIPRTTGCSDDAKIVQLEDQSCDETGGSLTGYSPVQGDSTQLCKYECSSGSLDRTSDCIAVQTECAAETPVWDTSTGECVSVDAVEPEEEEQDFQFAILVAIAVLAIILLMLLVQQRRNA